MLLKNPASLGSALRVEIKARVFVMGALFLVRFLGDVVRHIVLAYLLDTMF